MAERCALFVIIALGESILVTGATAAALPATTPNTLRVPGRRSSAASRCGGSISTSAPSAAAITSRFRQIRAASARAVYTYFHMPIVAGIVVCAVADEITISHPDGHVEPARRRW